MFGKRVIQEFDLIDSYEEEVIVIHNIEHPGCPLFVGAYVSNKLDKSAKKLSLTELVSLVENGYLKLSKRFEMYDVCLN